MNKIAAIALFSLFSMSCNESKQKENTESNTKSETIRHDHEMDSHGMELNKGSKWKADSSTNNNVNSIIALIETFKTGNDKSIQAYQQTVAGLEAGLNKMIRECRMQGPDHDALHKWLEPLINGVKDLKQSTTEENAAVAWGKIEAQVHLYDQYFE
ncbi:MAG TPA: hypothetical protein VFX58_12000 [Chitinophagaceae bacterium]|nr:hypothetical protein [Chitinophagaceae bacterium]